MSYNGIKPPWIGTIENVNQLGSAILSKQFNELKKKLSLMTEDLDKNNLKERGKK